MLLYIVHNIRCIVREVTEDERADAFWQAPFALIVQDDSKESMLEYANKKVGPRSPKPPFHASVLIAVNFCI